MKLGRARTPHLSIGGQRYPSRARGAIWGWLTGILENNWILFLREKLVEWITNDNWNRNYTAKGSTYFLTPNALAQKDMYCGFYRNGSTNFFPVMAGAMEAWKNYSFYHCVWGQSGLIKFKAVTIVGRWLLFASHGGVCHLRLLAEIWYRILGLKVKD